MTDDTTSQDAHEPHPDDLQGGPADRPLPPIPDGGLGAGMPDWLTRPTPATLRRMARRQGARRPEAADFARAEDVPGWLAAIRTRGAEPPAAVAAVEAATAFPRIEPVFVEARPPGPVPTDVMDAPTPNAAEAATAPVPPPPPTTAPTPDTVAPDGSGGTPAVWIVVAILVALAIAFGIGMLAGAGYRP